MKKTLALTCGLLTIALLTGTATADMLDPSGLSATASTTYSASYPPIDAVNGSGLTGEAHTAHSPYDLWMASTTVGEWFKIDLGGTYDVAAIKVWNYNRVGSYSRGVKQADIYTATSDPGDPPTGWTLQLENQSFTMAPGRNDYGTNTDYAMPDFFTFATPVSASHIAIVIDSNHGGDYVGLSEVQVFVPEPATMGLLGLGFAGMAALRRRRKRA